MAFTNNRLDFYNLKSYDEKTHAAALGKGIPSFVVKGLDLNGTILDSGIFTNTGTFGQLGNEGETHIITSNYTGYVIIKSTLSGNASTSVVELSTTRKDTDERDTSNTKYFTIYQLDNGVVANDFRHSNYIKDLEINYDEPTNTFNFEVNGKGSNYIPLPATTEEVYVNLQIKNSANFVRKMVETKEDVLIDFIGDSLTRGYDVVNGAEETYTDDNGDSKTTSVVSESTPEIIQRQLSNIHTDITFTILNSGWSGDVASDSVNRWFLDKGADLTTIMLGTNDDSNNVDVDTFSNSIETQIRRRLGFGSAVLLFLPPFRLERQSISITTYRSIMKNLGKKYGIPVIDYQELTSQFDYKAYSDATHYNQNGYRQVGFKICGALMNGQIFQEYHTVKDNQFITLGNKEEWSAGGLRITDIQFPTKQLVATNIDGVEIHGVGSYLEPGQTLYIGAYLEEKNLLVIPQLYKPTEFTGSINLTRAGYVQEKIDNAYSYVIDTAFTQQNVAPFRTSTRNTSFITAPLFTFRSNSVYCLQGAINAVTKQNEFLNCPGKGWHLFLLDNVSDSEILIHGFDFINMKTYQNLTGCPPIAYEDTTLLLEDEMLLNEVGSDED